MRLIDSHCHPQFPQYDLDRDEVIRSALKEGVGMVCVGTDYDTSEKAIQIAEKYEGVWASVGRHPNERKEDHSISEYEHLATSSTRVLAIGEIGLDYYRDADKGRQRDGFIEQRALAQRLGLPMIIHCRDAHTDMREILSPTARGVIHSFTGTAAEAFDYLNLGLYIGLNAIVTFSNEYAEMVRSLPANRIVAETDSPYLAPAPYRGRRNKPEYVSNVARYIADLRGVEYETLSEIMKVNTMELFNIDDI